MVDNWKEEEAKYIKHVHVKVHIKSRACLRCRTMPSWTRVSQFTLLFPFRCDCDGFLVRHASVECGIEIILWRKQRFSQGEGNVRAKQFDWARAYNWRLPHYLSLFGHLVGLAVHFVGKKDLCHGRGSLPTLVPLNLDNVREELKLIDFKFMHV